MQYILRALTIGCFVFALRATPALAANKDCPEEAAHADTVLDGVATEPPKPCPLPIVFELSTGASWLDPRHRILGGSFGRNQGGGFAYSGDLVGHVLDVGMLGMRAQISFERFLYAGLELGVGVGATSLPSVDANGYSIQGTPGGSIALGYSGGIFGGVRLPLSYVSLRFETLAGGRGIRSTQDTIDDNDLRQHATVTLETWTFEPRAFFDVWMSPRLTLSGFGGLNVGHFADRFFGVAIGYHARKYDGAFFF